MTSHLTISTAAGLVTLTGHGQQGGISATTLTSKQARTIAHDLLAMAVQAERDVSEARAKAAADRDVAITTLQEQGRTEP